MTSLFDVGRLCMKIAGRDAGEHCVVVERLDNQFVLIDGATRRRKVNTRHLEPLDKTLDVGSGNHEAVAKQFEALGFSVHTSKPKKVDPRPKKQKKVAKKEEPAKKVSTKKASKPEEKKVPEAPKVEEKKAEEKKESKETKEDSAPKSVESTN